MKKSAIALLLAAATTCLAQTDNIYYPLACGTSSPPSWCGTTADLGSWINKAAQAGPQGKIVIPASASCYTFKTPIVISSATSIWGDSKSGTCLQYTPTSGTAITYNGPTDPSVAGYGLRDLHLGGPNSGGYNTNSATGLLVATSGFNMVNVDIGGYVNGGLAGFHIGQTFGDGAYLDKFITSHIYENDQNVLYPSGLTNSGENIAYIHTALSNGGTYTDCVQIGTASMQNQTFTFDGVSFDHCQLVNHDNVVRVTNSHFEDLSGISAPFVVTWSDQYDGIYGLAGTTITGSDVWIDDAVAGNGFFEVDRFGFLSIRDMFVAATTTPLVYLSNQRSTGTPLLKIDSLDLPHTAAQLYSIASGTTATLNIKTLNVNIGP